MALWQLTVRGFASLNIIPKSRGLDDLATADWLRASAAEQEGEGPVLVVGPTFIDDIMAAAKQDQTLFEGAELMTAVLGPYFAGLDTVANTTSAMLYAVLKHRDVHEQVLAEVDGVFAAGPVTPESLRNMRVLHNAVMETLRQIASG